MGKGDHNSSYSRFKSRCQKYDNMSSLYLVCLCLILLISLLLISWDLVDRMLSSSSVSPRGILITVGEPNGDHCITDVDCAMNGECISSDTNNDPQAPGVCHCFGGWKGNTCEELDLLPAMKGSSGLQLPNGISTWGGSVVYFDGMYHMFASEMTMHCGLSYWTTNSQVIRAVSPTPTGPYMKQEVILPTFAHDANAILAPTGEIVLFVTARKGVKPIDCTTTRTTELKTKRNRRTERIENYAMPPEEEKNTTAPPKDTYMLYASHPEGPWSEPVMVLNSTIWNEDYWAKNHRFAHCDDNLNGIIKEDGSFLGLWRRCETPDLKTIPHTLTASDWRNASTYQPNPDPLFVLGGSGAEDPSNIWMTSTRSMGTAYHAIFHDEQSTRCMLGQCSGNGRHAFSLDGKAWSYSKTNAYDRHISFDDGSTMTADTRARPHVVVRDNQLLALSTGIEPSKPGVSDYVWTLVQPLRGSSTVP